MAVMNEFSRERESIKNAPFKVKLQYFWDYYKWHVLIPLVIIIIVSNHIYHVITDPETILNGVFLNSAHLGNEEEFSDLIQNLYETYDVDTEEYNITFNTTLSYSTTDSTYNYTTLQTLMAWSSAGAIDFMCSDKEIMTEFAYKGYFSDLRNLLTEEEIKLYEPYFQYIDQDVVNQIIEASEKMETNFEIDYPDCSAPDTMKEPIPVFIDVSETELKDIYGDDTEKVSFGIITQTEHMDMTLKMLDYLFK